MTRRHLRNNIGEGQYGVASICRVWVKNWTDHPLDSDCRDCAKKAPVYGSNPVFEAVEGWWFFNETWTEKHGPFGSEKEANTACGEYAKNI